MGYHSRADLGSSVLGDPWDAPAIEMHRKFGAQFGGTTRQLLLEDVCLHGRQF